MDCPRDSVAGSASGRNLVGVIWIEEEKIRLHVDEVVRETVEQPLIRVLPQWSSIPFSVEAPNDS
jgi:hypothetical protein